MAPTCVARGSFTLCRSAAFIALILVAAFVKLSEVLLLEDLVAARVPRSAGLLPNCPRARRWRRRSSWAFSRRRKGAYGRRIE